MRICALIPLYNEARTAGKLIRKVSEYVEGCLVVDDGSTDSSAAIASQAGAEVIRHSKNYGKGLSLRDGFKRILEQDFDAVIIIDGDNQHDPRDIPRFIHKAEGSSSGIILGNRMYNVGRMPLIRILTNKFMSWIISKVTGQKIMDSQCGYRLIKKEVLEKITLFSSRFEIESEILIKAARCNFKIASIPISSIYQKEQSKIDPLLDTLRFIRFIFKGNK